MNHNLDIYTRVPVNKAASIVTSQTGVTETVNIPNFERYANLPNVNSLIEEKCTALGINGSKLSRLLKAVRNGEVDKNDPRVQELRKLYKLRKLTKLDIIRETAPYRDTFFDVKVGDKFSLHDMQGKRILIDTVSMVNDHHFKGTITNKKVTFSKKTGHANRAVHARHLKTINEVQNEQS